MVNSTDTETSQIAETLLDIGLTLLKSGANTSRTRLIMTRFIRHLGYEARISITHLTIYLAIAQRDSPLFYTAFRQTPHYGVNFAKISHLRQLSWRVSKENFTLAQIREEIAAEEANPTYPTWVVTLGCGLFSGSLARLFGADGVGMAISFLAASLGFWTRVRLSASLVYPALTLFFAALVSSLVAGFFLFNSEMFTPLFSFHVTDLFHSATFIASLLYLVPGVPLVNGLSDLVDGFTLNGVIRLTNAFIQLFFSSLAISLALFFYRVIGG